MEEDVARWVRVEAAKADMSVSRYVGELLASRMNDRDAYQAAYRSWKANTPTGSSGGEGLPSRTELYDDALLRR